MVNTENSENKSKKIKKKFIIELAITTLCFISMFAVYLFESSIPTLLFAFVKNVVLLVGAYCFVNSIFDSTKIYGRTKL